MNSQFEAPTSHDESVVEQTSIVDSYWVRMYPKINGAASVVEAASGLLTGNISVAVDGMHGTAEIVIANSQITHAHEHDHINDKKRKRIYTALSGLALGAAGLALAEATGVADWQSDNQVMETVSWLSSGVAATSAWAAGTALVKRIRSKYHRYFHAPLTETEHDVTRHVLLLDVTASTLAFTSASARIATQILQSKGYSGLDTEMLEHSIGVASGLYGAYLFRPTKSNLQHHSHTESQETLPPAVEEMEQIQPRQRVLARMFGRKALKENIDTMTDTEN